MTTGVLALVTFGVCLTLLFVAVLGGEAIYHWVLPKLFDKLSGKGSKSVGVFELGEQDISEGVEALMENIGSLPVERCLGRHRSGDWGNWMTKTGTSTAFRWEKAGASASNLPTGWTMGRCYGSSLSRIARARYF